jgi:Protein of unknown function (DUF3040)
MSLRGSEQQALARIEQHLQAGDARLKSLFHSFARLTEHEQMPGREQIRQRWWAQPQLVVTIALLVILTGITAAVVTIPAGRCAVARTSVGSLPYASPHGAAGTAASANPPPPGC